MKSARVLLENQHFKKRNCQNKVNFCFKSSLEDGEDPITAGSLLPTLSLLNGSNYCPRQAVVAQKLVLLCADRKTCQIGLFFHVNPIRLLHRGTRVTNKHRKVLTDEEDAVPMEAEKVFLPVCVATTL